MPLSEQLSSDQISILNDLAPTIAHAIEAARHADRLDSHNLVIQNERERIARQLHDTLGQNLAYLRLKLDQMSTENALQEIDVVQQDLERMRDIAYQAHEQIRQTLVSLKPDGASNLNDLLLAQAQAVAEQAGFILHPHINGACVPLPSTIQRKIHAIFREALFNVEKHARADNVQLSILWEDSTASLTVALEDDGIGFDPQQVPAEGHFGLLIMQQRAEEINARLTISTAPSQGTRVALHYILPQPALASEKQAQIASRGSSAPPV
jgi:two-component system, NarL family, nitrate/nitrite sensor histidine kinase NarX